MRSAICLTRLVIVLAILAFPQVLAAQGVTQGQATVGGQAVTFVPAVGLWDAEQHAVLMLFATRALSADEEARVRRDGAWPLSGLGPTVKVVLSFVPGKYSGMLNELDHCWVGIEGFAGEPIELEGSAADCHLISTGGRLQPGGMLIGLLEGKGEGYAYRLPFSVMLPASATTTSAQPPVAAPTGPPVPADTVAGTGTYRGQTLRLTHGLAWVKGERLEVALFEGAPRAGILGELKSGSWGEGGPSAILGLILSAGGTGPAAVTYCLVNLSFPKGGSRALNANSAQQCGLTQLGGSLAPGGTIWGRLAGSTTIGDDSPVTWDLQFNVPLDR
jgi:hypothetical protein